MSNPVITARHLSKNYGDFKALDSVNLELDPGNIIGLIGPNGAGKTTLLKTLLGLNKFEGNLSVLGLSPYKQRQSLMAKLCFVSDVGVLPSWATVKQLLDLCKKIHPHFNVEKARRKLKETDLKHSSKIHALSKGMKAQLHLAIILSIDVDLLILDEPTLGLDIIHRLKFQDNLQHDYFDEKKTIIVTTHQVEEVERILTHLIFIDKGKLCLNVSMDDFKHSFHELEVPDNKVAIADSMGPICKRRILDKNVFMYEGQAESELRKLGELHTPSIADVFLAKIVDQSHVAS